MKKTKKSKQKQEVDKVQYRIIAYRYYCNKCSCFYKQVLDFDERLHQNCPSCGEELKYKGGAEISQSDIGNCGYISFEKGSQENIRRIGTDAYEKMCNEDKMIGARRKAREEGKKCWWREDGKPLDLNKIKDVDKYIKTGDKD